MNSSGSSKLKEALYELRAQETVLDNAIQNLEKIIATMNGSEPAMQTPKDGERAKSYLDIVVTVLQNHGKPLSAKELAYQVSTLKGKDIKRASLEATIFKHCKHTGVNARIEKVGPATYAIPS